MAGGIFIILLALAANICAAVNSLYFAKQNYNAYCRGLLGLTPWALTSWDGYFCPAPLRRRTSLQWVYLLSLLLFCIGLPIGSMPAYAGGKVR